MTKTQAGEDALPVNAMLLPNADRLDRVQGWYFAILVRAAASRLGHA